MQRFRVDLKAFLGLAMPNQCCQAVTKYWFAGGILGKKNPKPYTPLPKCIVTLVPKQAFARARLIGNLKECGTQFAL